MDLVLIRHPAVDAPAGVCYGQTDLALRRQVGKKAAETPRLDPPAHTIEVPESDTLAQTVAAIVQRFRYRGPVLACFASPLRRCADVAHALTRPATQFDSHALAPRHVFPSPIIDPRLMEIDFGAWEMQRWDDIPREQIDSWALDVIHGRPHQGESAHMLAERCASWLHDLTVRMDSMDTPARAFDEDDATRPCILVVGHAGPMRFLAALALGMPLTATLQWPLDFGGVVTLRRSAAPHVSEIETDASGAHAECAGRPTSADTRPGTWTLRQWNG